MKRHPQQRQRCPEVLPDGRHPRLEDARDVAELTVAMFGNWTSVVALYVQPNGHILRVSNPRLEDGDMTRSCVGVFDCRATVGDIVEAIMAMEA